MISQLSDPICTGAVRLTHYDRIAFAVLMQFKHNKHTQIPLPHHRIRFLIRILFNYPRRTTQERKLAVSSGTLRTYTMQMHSQSDTISTRELCQNEKIK